MYEIAQNRFIEGVSKDVSSLLQKDTTALHLENMQVFTKENQSYALTTIRGTKQEFLFPANYHPLVSKTYANVCYLLLAEVINGVATGRGQIGCFPSPTYALASEGPMVNLFQPFHNYSGDNNEYPAKNGPFLSAEFKFDVTKNVDLVIQPSYDGSVNAIFTDGKNPMRIINSGFASVNGSDFKLIVRDAGNEENKYNRLDFENRINLNLYTRTIAKVNFLGVFSGGQVKAGNNRYYFKYSTNDGDETFFLGQSGLVQIAPGNTGSTISGGKGDGEDTDKQVRFHLTNLDENYGFVVVYLVHNSGENSTVETVYRMQNRFPIRNGQVYFTHSGFESLDREDVSVLQDIYGQIDTADTLTEVQGYLIAGGIKQKTYDRTILQNVARQTKLIHAVKNMEAGLSPLNANLVKQLSDAPVQDFFNLGYLNPLNTYHGTGYWGGEANPFGARFLLNNGELTDVYPVLGCDNLNGSLTEANYLGQNFDLIDSSDSGFETVNGFNSKGIYRFPKRSATGLYNPATDTINVNGIRFILPVIPEAVKLIAKGIVLVRAERKKNVLQQGILTDVFKVPLDQRTDYGNDSGSQRKLATYPDFDTLFKLVPAPGLKLEASFAITEGKQRAGNPGVHYAHFADNYSNYRTGGGYQDSFAYFSGENFCEREKAVAELARKNIKLQPLQAISFLHDIRTARANSGVNGDSGLVIGDHFSVLVPQTVRPLTLGPLSGRATYIFGGFDPAVGEDSFSSACYFMDTEFSRGQVGVFPLTFDDYVGIKLTGAERFTISASNGKSQRLSFMASRFNKVEEMAYLVSLYGEGGLWDTTTLKQNYLNLSELTYHEISERMDWAELETKLDAGRGITLFGGDCFLAPTYRRLYRNRFGKNETVDEDRSIDSIKEGNVGVTMAWIAESNYNTALRVPLLDNINSNEPTSFSPYSKDLSFVSEPSGNNSWRRARIGETIGFNHGYKKLRADSLGGVIDFDRPFTNNDWYSRLMNSAKHVPNAFVNGYRQWGFDLQDYDASKGRIIKLVPFGNDLLMIQEDGISVVPINQRMESSNDAAGPVFIESTEVLSPYQGYKSHHLGSQHPDSIHMTENGIYGYDAKRFTWWMIAINGQMKSLSDLKIASDLEKNALAFSRTKFNKYSSNVVAGWDVSKREIYLSFFDTVSGKSFTIGYSELSQIHTGEKDYQAVAFFSVNHRTYSVPVLQRRKVFLHDAHGADRLNIYGFPRKGIIRFVVNKQHEENKVFDFIELVSNNVLPERIIYWVQGASSTQQVVYNAEDIIASNAKYREEKAVINIPRTDWVNDQSVTRYLSLNEDNAETQIEEGARVRGKVMVIELQYNSNKLVEISSVLTYFRKSLR